MNRALENIMGRNDRMKVSNRDVFQGIMRELRSLPEESDRITAFGYHPDDYTDIDVLGDFAEVIWGEEDLKSLTDDPIGIIGPKRARIEGGMGDTYIKTLGQCGATKLTIALPEEYSFQEVWKQEIGFVVTKQ